MTFEYPFFDPYERKSNENLRELITDFDEIRYREISAREAAQREPDRLEKTLLEVFAKIDAVILFIKKMVLIPVNFVLSIVHSVQRGYLFSKNFVASKYFSFIQSLVALRTFVQNSISSGKDFISTQVNAVVTHINTVNNNIKASVVSAKDFTFAQANAVVTRFNTVNNNIKDSIISRRDFVFTQANAVVNQVNTGISNIKTSIISAKDFIFTQANNLLNQTNSSLNNIKASVISFSREITHIYSQVSNNLSHTLRNNLNSIVLRPALVTGLIIALILPNAGVAYAEEIAGSDSTSVVEEVPVTEPTEEPTAEPSVEPTTEPSVEPTTEPTVEPSPSPSEITPSEVPTIEPTPSPSVSPTLLPIVIEAPTNLSYQVLVEGIKLTWEKSVSTIDKYVVTIGPENRTIDVNADLNELLLTDLNRKAAYSFSVIAVAADLQSSVLGPLELDLATIKFPRPPMNAEVGGLIVKFNEDLTSQQVTSLADTSDLTPVSLEVSSEISTDTRLVEFNQPVNVATAQEIADALEASNSVEFAELDFAFNTANTDDLGSVVPNDPLYATKQWSLWGNFGIGIADGPTGLAKAYQSSTGLGVTVAVIDTGFTNHPDLEGQFVSGYDFVSNNEMLSGIREVNGTAVPYDGDYVDESTYGAIGWDDNPLDPGDWNSNQSSSWHGTHIAGLIAALTNNGIGIAGIAPDAKIQPIRAFSWRGGLLSDVIASITWASGGSVENVPNNQTPAKVINLSFSVEAPCTPSLQLAIDDAIARGSVVVAAAGNNNQDAGNFAPGNCNNVITVGAIDADGDRANYSNFGEVIDISAPGGEIEGQAIYSTSNEGTTTSASSTYAVRQGTSVATAQVSAALAKLAQTNPTENAVQLRARVLSKESVRPFTSGACLTDENCGLGYLFFKPASVNQFMLNNEKLRFGGGGQEATSYTFVDSFNDSGMPEQPFYKAADNKWYKLTYANIPLSFALGSGTGGSNWSGANIPAASDYIGMTSLSGMTVDVAQATTRSPSQAVAYGYGTVTVSGTYDLNGDDVGISHKYELGANDSFIKVTTTVTNNELTTINNLRLWVGTRDDWVRNTDGPSKERGNIVNGAFQAISNRANDSSAIKIFTADEGIVFYSTTPNTSTAINSCCRFINVFGQNPTTSAISETGDGSYAITLPGGNVAAGNSVSIVWFYAAGAINDLDDIVSSVAAAASPAAPSVIPTSSAVNLTWTEPSSSDPITGYKIRYSTDGGSNWTTSTELGTTREYDWTGLTNGTSYLFQVAALTGNTNPKTVGSYSASSTAIPGGATAPTISSITAGNQKLTVSFSAPSSTGGSPITDYEYSTNNGSTWVSSGSVTSPIVISGLTNGTTYQVKLRAKGSFAGVPSGATSGTPIATVASAPTISSISTGSQTLSVNFSAPTDNGGSSITNYRYSTDGVNYIAFSPAQTTSPLTISFLSNGGGTTALIDGVSYPITIKAVNTTGDSVASNSISATSGVVSSGGGSITPTPTPTPTPVPTRTPRPNNLITNPLSPTPPPTPVIPPTLVPGVINGPRQLVVVPVENLINALRPRVVDIFTTPTPQATTAGATPAPTFSNQRALELAPDTQDKKVVELPSLVLYNNEFQPSKLVIVENTVAQVVSPGGGLLNVEAKDGQDSVPVDNRGRVQMVRSNNVETEGTGMQPNSEFAVYLFSDPILLGIGKTDAQGKFFASFPVTNELPIGDHTLQVNGLLPDGRATSVSLPVIVVDTVATAKNQAMPKTIFVDVNPVDNALRAVYWMLIVLAVMVFLIGASYRERFFALVRRRKDDEENVQPAL